MVTEKEDLYLVTGGYEIDDFKTDDYSEALKVFLNRIKHTKPLTGSTIQIYHYVTFGDLIIKVEIMHRVVLI